jgi:hypothetical protein
MLNHIIRLQAVVKIITNKATRALNLPAKQSTKMCNTIYQNCLALDYLLASEGGVCEKCNLSNSYLQIDDFKKSQIK